MYYAYADFDGVGIVPVTITKRDGKEIYAASDDGAKYLLEENDLFNTQEEANEWVKNNKPTLLSIGDWR